MNAAPAKMTADEARQVFNEAISRQTDPDKIATLELQREFLCNPEFRKWLGDYVYQLTSK